MNLGIEVLVIAIPCLAAVGLVVAQVGPRAVFLGRRDPSRSCSLWYPKTFYAPTLNSFKALFSDFHVFCYFRKIQPISNTLLCPLLGDVFFYIFRLPPILGCVVALVSPQLDLDQDAEFELRGEGEMAMSIPSLLWFSLWQQVRY